jgi:DNA-directed RNA polymerase specialized sigma24 family protein
MDEPDWDEKRADDAPDWVFDTSREPDDSGDYAAATEDRLGVGEIGERHPKAYDRWTPPADADLVTAYLAGRRIEELAEDFGRQPSAIQRRLERLAFVEMTRRRATPTSAKPG